VLELALRQQPQNVDVLYSLAWAETALQRKEDALRHLAVAARLDARRADVQKLLAITTGDLSAYADSLAAWDRYLALQPADAEARRERSYTAFCAGRFAEGLAGLREYVKRQPRDATGYYLLGLAESESDPGQGLADQEKAIALQPEFVEARAARGVLHYRQGQAELALPDLEFAALRRPDAINLDRLGQTYLSLERPGDAVRVLRRAAALARQESRVLLHLGRALAEAGEKEESRKVLEQFRQLGPEQKRSVPAGLVDYMALTPDERRGIK
jgi:tetratricopeptide (TPR) repeat protein